MAEQSKQDATDFFQKEGVKPIPETTEAEKLLIDHKLLYTMLGSSIKLNNEQIARTLQSMIGLCIERVEDRLDALTESASI